MIGSLDPLRESAGFLGCSLHVSWLLLRVSVPCAEAELLLLFLLGGLGRCRGQWEIWSLGWKGDWRGEKGETSGEIRVKEAKFPACDG